MRLAAIPGRFINVGRQIGRGFNPIRNFQSLLDAIGFLFVNRQLAYEMAKKEILERSHGQAFGYLWIFFHPLLLLAVYSFIFVIVVKMRHPEAVSGPDYGMYVLSGLLVWLGSAEALSRASTVLRSNASLIKQVIFPVEVLPISNVLMACFTQIIFTVGYVIVSIALNGKLHWTYLLLPIIFIVQVLGLIGLSFFISAISVYFKDVREIMQAYLTVAVYTLPLFFTSDQVPQAARWIFDWNPFTAMIFVFRDVLYHGDFVHPWAWGVFIGGSLFLLGAGFRFFRKVKIYFGSII